MPRGITSDQWKKRLASNPARGGRVSINLSGELRDGLMKLAEQENTTAANYVRGMIEMRVFMNPQLQREEIAA
jgi:hypothetical protein